MKKVLVVFGTRPEAIKMAPVIRALSKVQGLCVVTCVTAQHRQMLDQVMEIFAIRPDHDLNVMSENQDLFGLSARLLSLLGGVLIAERPDLVLVQGDTTTTFIAALSAFYLKIPVGHVEAGLRTFDNFQPFPEEMNRRLTTALSDYHFVPTPRAMENLLREGIPKHRIHLTGNTVVDALRHVVGTVARDRVFQDRMAKRYAFLVNGRRIVLVTGHRRENFGVPLGRICLAIRTLAMRYPEITFVYPVHLNPNIKGPVEKLLGGIVNVNLIMPLDYCEMVHFMTRCTLIMTDSGGIQEEAPSLGKPVLVLREKTERPEAVEAGTARIVGTDVERIVDGASLLLDDEVEYRSMATAVNPFGDGTAGEKIACIVAKIALGESPCQ